jgi:hypothetical protein
LTGLNVPAAPLAPPYAPAMTRTIPASCGSEMRGRLFFGALRYAF